MSDSPYRLSNSREVSEQMTAILNRAREEGRLQETLAAARWIADELRLNPNSFGESRNFLQHAELQMRVAFVQPLFVIFAIHEPSRTVYVGRVVWYQRT